MPRVDLSVVIVSWNTRELTLGCIGAIGAASAPLLVETIVVDNGSTDGTPGAIQERFPEVRVIEAEAGAVLGALDGADVAIVDPPRTGLEAALVTALAAAPPARVVYVSCDLGSFARDAEALLSSGRLRLAALEAWALFPNTEHVETLARFERT